jgi:hypothetical protein
MTRRTVRVDTLHFAATVVTLGQQTPMSSAASANAISTSFGTGLSVWCQAQFMVAMLTPDAPSPPVWSVDRGV